MEIMFTSLDKSNFPWFLTYFLFLPSLLLSSPSGIQSHTLMCLMWWEPYPHVNWWWRGGGGLMLWWLSSLNPAQLLALLFYHECCAACERCEWASSLIHQTLAGNQINTKVRGNKMLKLSLFFFVFRGNLRRAGRMNREAHVGKYIQSYWILIYILCHSYTQLHLNEFHNTKGCIHLQHVEMVI